MLLAARLLRPGVSSAEQRVLRMGACSGPPGVQKRWAQGANWLGTGCPFDAGSQQAVPAIAASTCSL